MEKLSSIDYAINKISSIIQGLEDYKKDLEDIMVELQSVKNTSYESYNTLMPAQISDITNIVNSKVIALLGGKDSEAYQNKNIRSKAFKDLYSLIHLQFGIKKLDQLQQRYIPKCKSLICEYKLSVVLNEQVRCMNG